MAIMIKLYVFFGWSFYIYINYVSYTHQAYQQNTIVKVLFSLMSFMIIMILNLIIFKSELLFKKPFSMLKTQTKLIVLLGILIAPLISLYY